MNTNNIFNKIQTGEEGLQNVKSLKNANLAKQINGGCKNGKGLNVRGQNCSK
jgi:hypothetical protein